MYFVAGGNVVALNADSRHGGVEVPAEQATPGGAVRRGMTYWPGTPPHAPRVLVTISDGKLVQLDAKTGQADPAGRRHRSRQRHHGPDSRRRVVHDRVARRRLQEPRDLSRPHRRAQPLGHSRRSARVRSADGQGGVALPHRAAARRSELRHLGPERLAGSQGPRIVAAADGRQRERAGLRRARQRRRSELRQQPARLESLCRQRRRARRRHRQVQVALPDGAPRHLRRRPERAADVRRGQRGTASASPRSCR